jgi:hypothetical protein
MIRDGRKVAIGGSGHSGWLRAPFASTGQSGTVGRDVPRVTDPTPAHPSILGCRLVDCPAANTRK